LSGWRLACASGVCFLAPLALGAIGAALGGPDRAAGLAGGLAGLASGLALAAVIGRWMGRDAS
jgi:TRAP-type uncharacterized transport system fused permease subunit